MNRGSTARCVHPITTQIRERLRIQFTCARRSISVYTILSLKLMLASMK